MAPPARRTISPALASFLVVAVAFGVAAALLTGPSPPVPTATPSPSTVPASAFAYVGYALLAIAAVALGRMLYLRVTGQTIPPPRIFVLGVLAIFLVCLGFLVVARFAGSGGSFGTGSRPPSGNGTNGTPPPSPSGIPPSGPVLNAPGLHLPGWAILVAIGIAVIVVVLVVLPLLLARRTPLSPHDVAPPVRETFARALRSLDEDPAADPRQLIIDLYGALLSQIGGRVGDVEARTPREIERAAVGGLGLRPDTAGELTGLFEEARYSTHQMSRAAADRARLALRQALRDLDARRL